MYHKEGSRLTEEIWSKTLPASLGLSNDEMEMLSIVIKDAKHEPISRYEVISALRLAMERAGAKDEESTVSPAIAILEQMEEHLGLIHRSIAYRAYAKGKEIGQAEAKKNLEGERC